MHVANTVPCRQMAGLFARPPAPTAKPADSWAVELVGSSSDATALAAYRQLQERHVSILADREPRVVHHGLARGSMGWARVHVGADSRTSAEKLCANLSEHSFPLVIPLALSSPAEPAPFRADK
jgi:hypothetical protein